MLSLIHSLGQLLRAPFGVLAILMFWAVPHARAAPLSNDLEFRIISNVGSGWTNVALNNSYTNAVPVCTYVTASTASESALPRIRNIQSDRFELKIQEMTGGSNPLDNPTPGTVFCVIADEGLHTLPDGRTFEAITVLSDRTTGQANGNWNYADLEDLTGVVAGVYTAPVALVGLISSDDAQPSAPFVNDCENRGNPAFASGPADGLCVGKHTGQIATSRANETIGVIIAESGTGTVNDIFYRFERGANTINGVGTNTSTGYSVPEDFDAAVATQTGENGGQGGWATFIGADPLPAGFIRISIDEEVVAGDTSRTHINEEVDVFAFRDDRPVELAAEKTNTVWDPGGVGLFAVPGEDITYTLTIRNVGNGAADPGSVFIVDALPPEVDFYNGDYDPGDADTAAVLFEETASGLSFDPALDLGFSAGPVAPADFSQCTYAPAGGYDANVRFICLRPTGAFQSGMPSPSASFSFRARIR